MICGFSVKITVFYIIFYALLSAFFYACYQIFATTLERPEDGGSPKWRQDASLIGSNPGIGFRPMPDQDKNSESTLIWFNTKSKEDYTFWSDQLTKFVDGKDFLRQPWQIFFAIHRTLNSFNAFHDTLQNRKCPRVPAMQSSAV